MNSLLVSCQDLTSPHYNIGFNSKGPTAPDKYARDRKVLIAQRHQQLAYPNRWTLQIVKKGSKGDLIPTCIYIVYLLSDRIEIKR
jgi:hypothetical protein